VKLRDPNSICRLFLMQIFALFLDPSKTFKENFFYGKNYFFSTEFYHLISTPTNAHTKHLYIKTFKIAPTCFDPKIIFREVHCSLLKSHFLKKLTDQFPYINSVLWQHVVLCKSYAAESAPGYGCVSCVILRETVQNTRCNDKDTQFYQLIFLRR